MKLDRWDFLVFLVMVIVALLVLQLCGCSLIGRLSALEQRADHIDNTGVKIEDVAIDGGTWVMTIVAVLLAGTVPLLAYLGYRLMKGGSIGPSSRKSRRPRG